MPQPDPRDEFVEAVTSSVIGIMRAVHYGDGPAVLGHVAVLVNTIIERNARLTERPSDEPLRAAVARLNAGGQHSPPVAE